MEKKNLIKRISLAVPSLLLVTLMTLNYSCDALEDEMCLEVTEMCEETVILCSSTTDEYFVFNGDTIYCEAIENCETAETTVVHACTEEKAIEVEEIKVHLSTIMASLRSQVR